MTFRMLTKDENFNSITGWLNEYLNNQKSFVPELNNIPNLTKKGIYFWFIHPDGYQEMSKKIHITALESRYSRMINGISYDLIYIGTAGTRNTGTGTNNGDLKQRFKWHINNNIGESSVKGNSPMSTLRQTLIPLFSDDLLLDNAQQQLNNYFAKYFYTFYMEYSGSLIEVSSQIGSDEIMLIKNLNPLFNIKHNQNIYLPSIRRRKKEVRLNTKSRLGFTKNSTTQKTDQSSKNKKMNEYSFLLNGDEYKLTYHEKPCITKNGISEPVLPSLRRYILAQNLNIQLTDHNGQNKTTNVLSKDFLKHFNENNPLKVKPKEKSEKFLPIQNKSTKSEFSIENIDKSHFFIPSVLKGKTLIIINCCKGKRSGGNITINEDFFDKNKGEQYLNFSTSRNEIISKKKDQISSPELQMEAYSRYDGSVYREINWKKVIELHNQNKIEVLIVSALFGLVEFQHLIPEYDLTIKETKKIWGNTIMEAVNQFVKDKEISNIFNCLSNDYSSLIPEIKATPLSQGSNQKKLGLWINSIIEAIR